jgi:hypothetical protein
VLLVAATGFIAAISFGVKGSAAPQNPPLARPSSIAGDSTSEIDLSTL